MRVNINLASTKYEDVRQFYVGWRAALAVLTVLTVLLSVLAYVKHARSVASMRQASELQQNIAELQKQRDELAAFENLPQNRDVTQQKKFWNSQIARRSFSWTQLLNDMQKIMPRRAYLAAVQPELTPDNRLKLKLIIAGEKRDDARELVVRMEDSSRFHDTFVRTEGTKPGKPGVPATYDFEIEAFYTPAGPAPSAPPAQNQRGDRKTAQAVAKEGF